MINKKNNLFSAVFFFAIVALLLSSCSDNDIPVPPDDDTVDASEGKVAVWRSDKAGLLKIAEEPELIPYESANDFDVSVAIDETTEYQSMEGFGAALTGSSAYVIQTHLSEAEQDQLLNDLFNTETGIGISFIRLIIGASDFSLNDFTYNDLAVNQSDISQNNFDISREEEYLIPLLQKILVINPNLKIMATPWSAPAWMKDNEKLKEGGRLKSTLYESYSTYLIKYIQAMGNYNIPIHTITVQNEPLYAAPYISMEMSSEEQKVFIRDHLGPQLEANNIDTKIIIYDHNWDDINYPLDILSDETAKGYIEGTAFHCYAG
ncbi:MAG: glucan endo-1,6-beta-glucosidase, partial [Saprospiraceae bacterium]